MTGKNWTIAKIRSFWALTTLLTTGKMIEQRDFRLLAVLVATAASATMVSGCQTQSASHADATINVHVGLFAAFEPKGEEAKIGFHQPNKDVTVTASNGRTWNGKTNAQGRTAFSVPPGEYRVATEGCEPEMVDPSFGETIAVNIICQGF